jgi:hypothetical protein
MGEWAGGRDWESENMVRNLKGEINNAELGMLNLMNAMQDSSLLKGMAEGLRQPEGRAELIKMMANPRFQEEAQRVFLFLFELVAAVTLFRHALCCLCVGLFGRCRPCASCANICRGVGRCARLGV